tara:strand:+ start:470 stop:652 length:183 start_codon:yes stop_codon:yes gene_type:complete
MVAASLMQILAADFLRDAQTTPPLPPVAAAQAGCRAAGSSRATTTMGRTRASRATRATRA